MARLLVADLTTIAGHLVEAAAVIVDERHVALHSTSRLILPPPGTLERLQADPVAFAQHVGTGLYAELTSAISSGRTTNQTAAWFDHDLAEAIERHCPGDVLLAGAGVDRMASRIAQDLPLVHSHLGSAMRLDIGHVENFYRYSTGGALAPGNAHGRALDNCLVHVAAIRAHHINITRH